MLAKEVFGLKNVKLRTIRDSLPKNLSLDSKLEKQIASSSDIAAAAAQVRSKYKDTEPETDQIRE